MPIWTTQTAATARLDSSGRGRAAAELLLAYGVWGLGLVLLGPVGEFVGGSGASLAVVVIYPLLIQLPLAIHYDRALGFSARPATRWQFVGARLFHPVVVYGLFLVLLVNAVGILVGAWGPAAAEPTGPGEAIGLIAAYIVVSALGYAVLLAYFPLVTVAALALKWGQRGLRRLVAPLRSSGGRPSAPPPGPGDGAETEAEADVEAPREQPPSDRHTDDRPPADADVEAPATELGDGDADIEAPVPEMDDGEDGVEAPAGDDAGTTAPGLDEESPLDSRQNVRFVSLLGLVLLPIGGGFFTGQPELGISVASLLLTVYQLSYNQQAAGG